MSYFLTWNHFLQLKLALKSLYSTDTDFCLFSMCCPFLPNGRSKFASFSYVFQICYLICHIGKKTLLGLVVSAHDHWPGYLNPSYHSALWQQKPCCGDRWLFPFWQPSTRSPFPGYTPITFLPIGLPLRVLLCSINATGEVNKKVFTSGYKFLTG